MNLRTARLKRGSTQAEVAAAAGITQQLVSLIEHGLRPSAGTQQKLAKALGMPASELFPDGH